MQHIIPGINLSVLYAGMLKQSVGKRVSIRTEDYEQHYKIEELVLAGQS